MGNHIWPLVILVLIYLAPAAAAAAAAAATSSFSLLAATVASIATDNTSNNMSTVITANTIASWNTLSSSITAAAGKVVTLTLSTPFDMTGFQSGSAINIKTAMTANTAITIVGNGAVFDAGGKDRFFYVDQAVALVMSNVTLQNGNSAAGAIYVNGAITLSDCSFSGNTAGNAGGALYFWPGSNGLLKNCSLLGTASPKNNDIARTDTTANVTFACADGEVGTPVQMSGSEITKTPALTCTAQTYACHNGGKANWYCVPDSTSSATRAQCDEVCAP
jgi:hypothetical protein